MKKKNKKKLKILVIGLILVIAIIVTLIIFIKVKNNDNSGVEEIDTRIPIRSNVDMTLTDNVKIEDNIKYNTSEVLNQKHYLVDFDGESDEDIYIDNISLIGNSEVDRIYFKASITNNKEYYDLLIIYIIFYDNDGNFIHASEYHLEELVVGETREIEIEDVVDFTNAYDIKLGYN